MTTGFDWHLRYRQQARWTAELRRYFFTRITPDYTHRVIEIGCGTGAVLETAQTSSNGKAPDSAAQPKNLFFGLDINLNYLRFAKSELRQIPFTQGDAHQLPFSDASFDIVFCHYLILWLKNPLSAIRDMCRITIPGGWVAAFAEPDYGGRIDHPPSQVELGRLQTESLKRQGADPQSGRQLKSLFVQAGLVEVECGVLGAQWSAAYSDSDIEMEWQVVEEDLKEVLNPQELGAYRAMDATAWQEGARILFVPTFYAFGRVPLPK